jgi:hypothetical protein
MAGVHLLTQSGLARLEEPSHAAAGFLSLFIPYPIFSSIAQCLDIADIISITRTCKDLSTFYRKLIPIQFNVDKRLRYFVNDPLAFRSEIARNDALVTGSIALQFFERNSWLDNDLIVLVKRGSSTIGKHLVEVEGYTLTTKVDIYSHSVSTSMKVRLLCIAL